MSRMVVLSVIVGLLVLLAVACVWESRTGRPEWGRRDAPGAPPTAGSAARKAKGQVTATLTAAAAIAAADAGADG